jgi:hypothetical protein
MERAAPRWRLARRSAVAKPRTIPGLAKEVARVIRERRRCFAVLSLLLPMLAWCAQSATAQGMRPGRTAIVTSTGVDGDKRSWSEYDDVLRSLGWAFDKYANTDLASLWTRSSDYNLLLATSLWNYGDPVDVMRHAPALTAFLERGGIALLTDMSYPPMCDWLRVYDSGLSIEYGEAGKDVGARSAIAEKQPWPILSCPNRLEGFAYWAHFRKWGTKWTVMLETRAGTGLMLAKRVGRGVLIVTTGFGLRNQALENIYANAQAFRTGLRVEPHFPAGTVPPGDLRGSIKIENLEGASREIMIRGTLTAPSGPRILDENRVTLAAHESRTIPMTVPLAGRGAMRLALTVEPGITISHDFTVPPLVSASCNRYILAKNDTLVVHATTSTKPGALASTTWRVAVTGGKRTTSLADGPASATSTFRVAASKLGVGVHEVAVTATSGTEQDTRQLSLEVRATKRPPTICRFDASGTLIINGKPTLLLGTYHVDAKDLARIRALGFNCTTGPIYGGNQTALDAGQRTWLDEANRQHIMVLQELSEYLRSPERNMEAMQRMASELRLHPATIAHYSVDEPSGYGLPVDLVSRQCKLLEECDPEHIAYTLEVPGAVLAYARCAQAVGTDPYPIGSGTPESLASVGRSIGDLVKAAAGRPVWPALQAFRSPPATGKNRYPTIDEVRCMSYLALNHGAKSLLYYAWSDAYPLNGQSWPSGMVFDAALMRDMPGLLAELKSTGLAYLLGKVTPVAIPGSALDAVRITRGAKAVVVAVNPTSKAMDASIPVGGKSVAHHFGPFEVWIRR